MVSQFNITLSNQLSPFFKELREAEHAVLFLDYDGTLSPFTPKREEALPYPEVIEPLQEVIQLSNTRTILVTGRSIESILPLLPWKPFPEIWGSHGWERRTPTGDLLSTSLPLAQQTLLEKWIQKTQKSLSASQIEIKPYSLAIHWRGLPSEEKNQTQETIDQLWAAIGNPEIAYLAPFHEGVEVRMRGKTKGDVIAEVLAEISPDVPLAYFGDDKTDEDAFRTLGERGLKVWLGQSKRSPHADVTLKPPHDLVTFFYQWIEAQKLRSIAR